MNATKNLEKQIVNRIYGHGRGWAFSKNDFAPLGEPASIDRTLSRMAEKGTIRRVMRGLYDYPGYSALLGKNLGADIDQVAHALARKFGWQIQTSGNAALNILGLSTQVPTQYLFLSDGPSKTFQVGNVDIHFKKTRFTQLGLKYAQNEILVQAIRALGDRPLTDEERRKIYAYLSNSGSEKGVLTQKVIERTLKDMQYVTSWIVRNIRHVLLAANENPGSDSA